MDIFLWILKKLGRKGEWNMVNGDKLKEEIMINGRKIMVELYNRRFSLQIGMFLSTMRISLKRLLQIKINDQLDFCSTSYVRFGAKPSDRTPTSGLGEK
jgi:hypothetical protein